MQTLFIKYSWHFLAKDSCKTDLGNTVIQQWQLILKKKHKAEALPQDIGFLQFLVG